MQLIIPNKSITLAIILRGWKKTFSFTKIVIKTGPVGNKSLTKLVEVLVDK